MRRFTSPGPIVLLLSALLAAAPIPAQAKPHEVRIPLHDGKVSVAELSAEVCRDLHLPSLPAPLALALRFRAPEVKVSGLAGSLFVRSVSAALGDGCRVAVTDDALVLHLDPAKLPHTVTQAKRAVRTFTATDFPDATGRQARHYGLFLPAKIDPQRPVIVLVHGLDAGLGMLQPMGELLQGAGCQVGYFCYPSDQAIEESAASFADNMVALRETFPDTTIDIVAHSMGGLVARDYVEGRRYAGGVDHLILVGTPNTGSGWAYVALAQKGVHQYQLWRYEPDWSPSWAITEGLGDAAHDLKPNSAFLRRLERRPRREGVRYTVIAGDHHPVARIGGNLVERVAHAIGGTPATWWGLRQCRSGLEVLAQRLENQAGRTDGPVKLSSARLAGVDDFVVVHADHVALYWAIDGQLPAAWPVIRDRLGLEAH